MWTLALLLTFAVSSWGLHYKLSLYHPPTTHAPAPEAKLLSQKERPVASARLEEALVTGKPLASTKHPIAGHALAAWLLVALPGRLPELWVLSESQQDSLRVPLAPARPSAPRAPPIA